MTTAPPRPQPVALVAWATAAIALDIGVARVGYGAALPAVVRELGLSYTLAGLMSTVNLAAYLVGTLAAPGLARRHGPARMAIGGHAVVALGTVGSGLALGPISLGLSRALMGAGAGAGIVALLMLLFARTTAGRRPLVSAVVWSGFGFAAVLTGATLPAVLGAPAGWRRMFVLAGLAGLVIVAGVARQVGLAGAARAADASARSQRSAGRTGGLHPLVFAYVMFGAGYISYATFASVQMRAEGLATGAIAAAWMVLGTAAVVGCGVTAVVLAQPALGHLALTAAMACGALGTGALALGGSRLATVLAAILVGLGLASTPAIITAYLRARTTSEDYARLFSLATSLMGIGQLAGPAVAGVLADNLGAASVPWFSASAYLLGTAAALRDARHARPT